MRDVSIIGVGQTPVGEHWDIGLRHLALEAVRAAAMDAHIDHADALFVGNMSAAQIGGQTNLGALIADFVGLRGIEAVTIEASSASGAAAMRRDGFCHRRGRGKTIGCTGFGGGIRADDGR
jgi:acetyl-CoA C-acetyltransferase